MKNETDAGKRIGSITHNQCGVCSIAYVAARYVMKRHRLEKRKDLINEGRMRSIDFGSGQIKCSVSNLDIVLNVFD